MSTVMDESKSNRSLLDAPSSIFSGESHQTLQQESLLTNSFDEQIKLVEKSVTTSKNDNPKEKKRNKKQQIVDPSKYSNRSQIYRFDTKEQEQQQQPHHQQFPIVPPTTITMPVTDQPENETSARASMLMSWYMAGYQTGYYDAMKKFGMARPEDEI